MHIHLREVGDFFLMPPNDPVTHHWFLLDYMIGSLSFRTLSSSPCGSVMTCIETIHLAGPMLRNFSFSGILFS